MRLTRRELVGGAAAGALGAAGIYELVDRLTAPPKRRSSATSLPEQHLLHGLGVIKDNGVEVLVPVLHHQVVTAKVLVADDRSDLYDAREQLEDVLRRLDDEFAPTPKGLGVTVGWGMPYFRRYVSKPAVEHIPLDLRASRTQGRPVRALLDAVRFPSDPHDVRLEQNDVAVLLRSDERGHIAHAAKAIFDDLDHVFAVTSIR